MGTRRLMSIEDAARCAMAPAEDYTAGYVEQPEQALRNGHREAALRADGHHDLAYTYFDTVTHWVRDTFASVRGGRAAA